MVLINKWSKCILFSHLIILLSIVFGWSQQENNVLEKRSIKIAGLQMQVTTDIEQNKSTIIRNIKNAAASGAQFLVTPEGSLSGYHRNFNQQELDLALNEIRVMARKEGIGLFLGTCYKEMENDQEYCFNQVRVYSPNGDFLEEQSKYLTCSPIDYPGTGEMLDYVQGFPKVIEWQNIKFGILICNDLWASPGYTTTPNPYLPLNLKQLGAQVIIHSINSGTNQRYKRFHEASADLWAHALQIPILEVNAAKGSEKINARSGLINEAGERVILVPDIGEQLFYFHLEIPIRPK
jgi:predicted amidohydrolase